MKNLQKAPNFIVAGVNKCGTTFLTRALSKHPDVFICKPKEPFFFNVDQIGDQEFSWYVDTYFSPAASERWRGEGSTSYFHHTHAIDHIERFLGRETPIIVSLRQPIGRMISHYLHDYKRGRWSGSETLADNIFEGYLERSLYSERLELWQSRFPNLQVHFFDDLVQDGEAFFTRASDFLGLSKPPFKVKPINEGLQMKWRGDELILISEPPEGLERPRFQRAELEELNSQYAPDIERIMELTGRDLTNWYELPPFGEEV